MLVGENASASGLLTACTVDAMQSTSLAQLAVDLSVFSTNPGDRSDTHTMRVEGPLVLVGSPQARAMQAWRDLSDAAPAARLRLAGVDDGERSALPGVWRTWLSACRRAAAPRTRL